MKKLPFLCVTILFGNFLFGQSHTLKPGTLVPINNKAITILPTTPSDKSLVAATQSSTKPIVLVGGSMNPLTNDGNNLVLSNSGNLTYNGLQEPLVSPPNSSKPKTASPNAKSSSENFQPLTSLTDYGTSNSKKNEGSNGNSTSLTYASNTITPGSTPTNVSLEPLTYVAPKAKTQTSAESIDPSRISQPYSSGYNTTVGSQTSASNPYIKSTTSKETLPPRTTASIKTKMPELAPIEEVSGNGTKISSNGSKAQSGVMPELAPIEGLTNSAATKTNQSAMPELAPIEDENTNETKQNSSQNQDYNPENSNKVRGFAIPKGTLLQAKDNRSYIIKPLTPVKNIVPIKQDDSEKAQSTKPSAGGGIGFPTEIEEASETDIATIKVIETSALIQTQQQLQQAAKNHQHDPNNPCCRVQMGYNTAKKKVVSTKKPVYKKKKVYTQQAPVAYTYKADPVKTQNIERIVYVPTQQTYQEPKQQTQVYKPEPQQQKQAPSSQSQDKVVYRDYTNTYTKSNPSSQSSNCICPETNQNAGAKDSKKYYNPSNYASGLTSGPTSGDYPVSGSSSDADMKYTFYVNPKGKYGVSVFNRNCSVLMQQNGKVVEFKVYGDPKTEQPKLNYFGSPESIAGIPIEYNYNRTVHKIGNIKFDYDFEGYFKTVGNSNVQYTPRSTLSKVDNINVRYDAGGNVSGVDQNNGMVQYNP